MLWGSLRKYKKPDGLTELTRSKVNDIYYSFCFLYGLDSVSINCGQWVFVGDNFHPPADASYKNLEYYIENGKDKNKAKFL